MREPVTVIASNSAAGAVDAVDAVDAAGADASASAVEAWAKAVAGQAEIVAQTATDTNKEHFELCIIPP
jgi:hypothetical protein